MKESKKSRTRRAIIESAVSVFSRNGISATTFDMIAEDAGLARRTVYYHFSDRLDLLRAIIDARLNEALDEIREFRAGSTDIEALSGFCFRFWQSDPGLPVLFKRIQEEHIEAFSTVHSEFLGEFAQLFNELEDVERLRFKDPGTNLRLIFFSLFPLLEIIAGTPGYEEAFKKIFSGMMLDV